MPSGFGRGRDSSTNGPTVIAMCDWDPLKNAFLLASDARLDSKRDCPVVSSDQVQLGFLNRQTLAPLNSG